MPIPTSTKFVDAFGHNAGPDYITPQIPETTATPGAASFDQGFPPVTMLAPAAGGIPPFGQDFNGLLRQITAMLAFLNAGQLPVYDGTFATAIGGYAIGSLVAMADASGYWLSTVNANTTDPDSGAAAGWVPVASQGITGIGLSNTNVTMTPTQWKKQYIYLSGVLTGNVQVVFPTQYLEWVVINSCTGAFTVTARTQGGSGVIVPAGGVSSPSNVYCDGTNINFSVAPLSVPIDQAATPLTLAERTNAGYLLATYFNQNSAVESPAVGAIFVENTAHDGFLRKIDIADFIAALGLATQTYANGTSGSNANGFWYKLPNGVIEQYGTIPNSTPGSPIAHTFPIPFPTSCDALTATANAVQGTVVTSNPASSKTSFTVTNGAGGSITSWRAVGH